MREVIASYFRFAERGTSLRNEVLGGLTTFATMAYIIVVNPAILEAAGLPIGPSTVATILVAVVGSLLMGLYANRPLAVAPYMGENAFIAYGLSQLLMPETNTAITWQVRLGAVFVSGVLFLIITLLRVRTWLADAISPSMKHSFAVGIGLFLAFLGLYQADIVVSGQGVPVRLGNLRDTKVLLAIGGFLGISVLMCWRVRGSMLLGMIATAIVGYCLGVGEMPKAVMAMPFTGDYSLAPIAFHLDIRSVLHLTFLPLLLTLFLMGFLDTLGTLVGVGAAGGMLNERGDFPQVERPMLVDAIACVFSALIGSSTSGAFIESASGVREGARTGLAAVVVAILFAVCLFFIPLVQPLQQLKYAYTPALIIVGVMMIASVQKIDFDDPTEAIPAFVTLMLIVFSFNIANGLTAGLIVHPVLKALSGKWQQIKPGAVVLGMACLVYYVFGMTH